MKRILLPTDFSENAWNAVFYATELFKNDKCHFYLLNTFHFESFTTSNLMAPDSGNPAFKKAYNESQKNLKDIVDRMTTISKNVNHTYEIISENNFLLDAIKNLVEDEAIDLIIMGTKGDTASRSVNFGSNAVSIMKKIVKCPVLVVPDETDEVKIEEIVFPISYEYAYKKSELKPLLDMVNHFNSKLRILHIKEEEELSKIQFDNKELLKDDLEGYEHSFHTLENIDPALGIRCFAESRESDIIALVHKKHSFFERIMRTTVIKNVGFYTKIPLLVMHH